MKTQMAQIRVAVARIDSQVSDDSSALEAEEARVHAGLARLKTASSLVETCRDLSAFIDSELEIRQATFEDLTVQLHRTELNLQALNRDRTCGSAVADVRSPATQNTAYLCLRSPHANPGLCLL